jgi:hypothetical protein
MYWELALRLNVLSTFLLQMRVRLENIRPGHLRELPSGAVRLHLTMVFVAMQARLAALCTLRCRLDNPSSRESLGIFGNNINF